jgi:hypothetical protein
MDAGITPGSVLTPLPGSPEELRRFAELQRRLAPLFLRAFPRAGGVQATRSRPPAVGGWRA